MKGCRNFRSKAPETDIFADMYDIFAWCGAFIKLLPASAASDCCEVGHPGCIAPGERGGKWGRTTLVSAGEDFHHYISGEFLDIIRPKRIFAA